MSQDLALIHLINNSVSGKVISQDIKDSLYVLVQPYWNKYRTLDLTTLYKELRLLPHNIQAGTIGHINSKVRRRLTDPNEVKTPIFYYAIEYLLAELVELMRDLDFYGLYSGIARDNELRQMFGSQISSYALSFPYRVETNYNIPDDTNVTAGFMAGLNDYTVSKPDKYQQIITYFADKDSTANFNDLLNYLSAPKKTTVVNVKDEIKQILSKEFPSVTISSRSFELLNRLITSLSNNPQHIQRYVEVIIKTAMIIANKTQPSIPQQYTVPYFNWSPTNTTIDMYDIFKSLLFNPDLKKIFINAVPAFPYNNSGPGIVPYGTRGFQQALADYMAKLTDQSKSKLIYAIEDSIAYNKDLEFIDLVNLLNKVSKST
jgi:hypothetical protein